MQSFKVIAGGNQKRINQVTCKQCEQDIGIETSQFIESIIAPMRADGTKKGGAKGLVCIYCLSRGKISTY